MSPARRRINEVIREISVKAGKTLFVGVDKKWDYKKYFKDYQTLDTNPRMKPDIEADIQHCPKIADQTYDTVIMTGVYEYLNKPDKAFMEIMRILKPKGQALLCIDGFGYYHGMKPYLDPEDVYWKIKPLTLINEEILYYKDAFVPYYFILKTIRWK